MPHHLTPKEIKIIKLVAVGLPNKTIGELVGCGANTVKRHLNTIFHKLDIQYEGKPWQPRLKLAHNWNCELYQEGLRALGYIPPND